MNLFFLNIKLTIEHTIVLPFVWMGRCIAKFIPLKTKHPIFLLFSNVDLGGSIQINLDLARCLQSQNPLIILTKKPKNNLFYRRYQDLGLRIIDLHKFIDNKLFHFINFIFRGIVVEWAIQQKIDVIIGGENIFFYKIISHLPDDIKRIEMLHVDNWLEYNIGFIKEITSRVLSTEKLKNSIEQQYKKNKIPDTFNKKLFFIETGMEINNTTISNDQGLKVYFIGRGAAQKRPHLVMAIAEKIHQLNIPISFNFAGDIQNSIDITKYPYCNFLGSIQDEKEMEKIYTDADVLLLTSLFEGLPLAVMQMMAYGKTIVSTAVNSIPDYVIHEQNGLLIRGINENEIIEEGVKHLITLYENPDLKIKFGKKSKEIAKAKFSMEKFCTSYKSLIKQ